MKLPTIGFQVATAEVPSGTHCVWLNRETGESTYGVLEELLHRGHKRKILTAGLDRDPDVSYIRVRVVDMNDGLHIQTTST